MVSDLTVRRYYYIFDPRQQRALVLDRATGEEVAWASVSRVQLIEHVAANTTGSVLRRFARWCARQTGAEAVPSRTPTGQLWIAAAGNRAEQKSIRQKVTGDVVRAAVLGLPRARSAAARLLTVHACTHPDPRQGAIDAAHMSERWAEFEAQERESAAVTKMRQLYVDWLLDVLGSSEARWR